MNLEKVHMSVSKSKKKIQSSSAKSFIKNMPKKSFPKLLGLVLLYNSPKLYCSPSIIRHGSLHLFKYPR